MGVVLSFPVPARRLAARRIGRIFEPQEQLEAARLATVRFFALAAVHTALVVTLLQLAAR